MMRRGEMNQALGLILILVLSDPFGVVASVEDSGYTHCENIVKNWASSSIDSEVNNNTRVLRDFLFFLHVPRTGGRSYLFCSLEKMYSKSQRCPQSYEELKFNPRAKTCRLISTHDDYSLTSKFGLEKTSVVTILRDPINRVFSTYEFSVELAARALIHPDLKTATEKAEIRRNMQNETSPPNTLEIWPWKYLAPWVREDMFARRDARKRIGKFHFPRNNLYEMKDFAMTLHEYINDPMARDIVHNGATFQIAGLTNNSFFEESHDVRHCVIRHKSLGKHVLEVAKRRLDGMLYVGLMENHKESITMFANVVGSQVITLHTESSPIDNPEHNSFNDTKSSAENQVSSTNATEKLTVSKLIEAYENCTITQRKAESARRTVSLMQIAPMNFPKEDRKKVPEAVIQAIKSLNRLDIKLYNYAKRIFAQNQDKRLVCHARAECALSISVLGKETLVYHHNNTYLGTCFEKLGVDACDDCYNIDLEREVPWVVIDGQPLYDDHRCFVGYM